MKKLNCVFGILFVVAITCCKAPVTIFQRCHSAIVKIDIVCKQGEGSGSGVVVAPGVIATCAHVVSGVSGVKVITQGNEIVVSLNSVTVFKDCDLAFIQVKTLGIAPIQLETETPKIGDTVYALGNPLEHINVISSGLYNGVRKSPDGLDYTFFTAPISPGSSGGALLSSNGRLLGLTSAWMTGSQNINVAVPVSKIVEHLKEMK